MAKKYIVFTWLGLAEITVWTTLVNLHYSGSTILDLLLVVDAVFWLGYGALASGDHPTVSAFALTCGALALIEGSLRLLYPIVYGVYESAAVSAISRWLSVGTSATAATFLCTFLFRSTKPIRWAAALYAVYNIYLFANIALYRLVGGYLAALLSSRFERSYYTTIFLLCAPFYVALLIHQYRFPDRDPLGM